MMWHHIMHQASSHNVFNIWSICKCDVFKDHWKVLSPASHFLHQCVFWPFVICLFPLSDGLVSSDAGNICLFSPLAYSLYALSTNMWICLAWAWFSTTVAASLIRSIKINKESKDFHPAPLTVSTWCCFHWRNPTVPSLACWINGNLRAAAGPFFFPLAGCKRTR